MKTLKIISLLLSLDVGLHAQPVASAETSQIVTKAGEFFENPVWSIDGETLTFTSTKNNHMWKVSKNGENLRQISAPACINKQSEITTALFQQMVNDPVGVTKQVEGLAELNRNIVLFPTVSPSGAYIVFQADKGKGTFICNADGSNLRRLAIEGMKAVWTPCEKYIVMMVTKDDGHVTTTSELVCIDVNSGEQTILFSAKDILAYNPAISPDGKKIAFEDQRKGAIHVLDIE